MAEIDIERRNRPIWPWVLGLLGLVVLIWVVVEAVDRDDDTIATTQEELDEGAPAAAEQPDTFAYPADAAVPVAVTRLEDECAGAAGTPASERDEGACIRHLASAMEELALRDGPPDDDLQRELEAFQQQARTVESGDWQSPGQSAAVRDVFDDAADLLERIRDRRPDDAVTGDDRIDEVRGAASEIEAEAPLAEQRQDVAEFYREAAASLRALAGGTADRPVR